MVDELVVCVLTNPEKTGRFPLAERLTLPADLGGIETLFVPTGPERASLSSTLVMPTARR